MLTNLSWFHVIKWFNFLELESWIPPTPQLPFKWLYQFRQGKPILWTNTSWNWRPGLASSLQVCGPPGMMKHISGDKAKDRSQGEVSRICRLKFVFFFLRYIHSFIINANTEGLRECKTSIFLLLHIFVSYSNNLWWSAALRATQGTRIYRRDGIQILRSSQKDQLLPLVFRWIQMKMIQNNWTFATSHVTNKY